MRRASPARVAALACCLAAAAAPAQELAPRRLEIVASAAAPALEPRARALAAFLGVELSNATQVVLHTGVPAARPGEDPVPPEPADATLELALGAKVGSGYPVSATGRDSRKPDAPAFRIEDTIVDPGPMAAKAFFARVVKAAAAAFPPAPPVVVEKVVEKVVEETQVNRVEKGVKLAIVAPPGTRLGIPGRKKAERVPESGRWEIELPQSTGFAYRAEPRGFRPQDRSVYVGKEDSEDEVPLERLPRLELAAGLKYGDAIALPLVRAYLVPGLLFASASFETSYAAIAKPAEGTGWTPEYLEPRLGLGLWMAPADRRLRLAVTLEGAGRWEVYGKALVSAPVLAWCACPGALAELELGGRFAAGVAGSARLGYCPYDLSTDPAYAAVAPAQTRTVLGPHLLLVMPEPSIYARITL